MVPELTPFEKLISFTRTSAATYVNSAGAIVSTPSSKNLLKFTEEFDNAAWSKSNATITANSVAAPDGLMTADKLTETVDTGAHAATCSATVTLTGHVVSIYLQKGVGPTAPNWMQLYTGGVSAQYANFNLSTGLVGNVAVGSTASMESVGGGWYRCQLTFTPSSAGSVTISLAFTNNTDATTRGLSYAGATTSDVYAWGAQLEVGSTATSYVRNFGGLFPPRFNYDPVTLQPRGLLIEEQRTNLLLRSEEFDNASWGKGESTVTANAAVSPDGTADAEKLVPDSASLSGRVVQTSTGTIGATYTLSIYAKQGEFTNCRLYSDDSGSNSASVSYNLATGAVSTAAAVSGTWTSVSSTATNAGNGWWRLTLTWTATSAAPARVSYWCRDTGDGTSGIYLWGAQLEAGAFATSYIPTAASQVTRTADQASIVAPMFAPWYNQSEGTFVVEADSFSPTNVAVRFAAAAADAATSSRNTVFLYNGKWGAAARISGTDQCDLQQSGSYTPNVTAKIAFAYKANDFAASVNGAAVLTDTSGSIPAVDRLLIAGNGPLNILNGHIRRISYYPSRLSDAQLQALSA